MENLSVVPEYKNAREGLEAKKYCPVGLLFTVNKIFGKLINNKLVRHLEKSAVFTDFQCSLRASHSTADLLTVVNDRIARAFNISAATRAAALDIANAFDRVWHAGLLHLISSFRSIKRLRVVLDGQTSSECAFNVEVPQGSILGPNLLLLQINDLPDNILYNIAI